MEIRIIMLWLEIKKGGRDAERVTNGAKLQGGLRGLGVLRHTRGNRQWRVLYISESLQKAFESFHHEEMINA